MRKLAPLLLLAACGSPAGPHVMMDPARTTSFFDAPWPADGADLAGFPDPSNTVLLEQARTLAGQTDGFATTGGVFFRISDPIDPTLLTSDTAFLVSLDDGQRWPVDLAYQPDNSTYGATNLVSLLPHQGVPLRRHTRYAAVLTTGLGVDPASDVPAEIAALSPDVAGWTIFTTGDPTAELAKARTAALARPLPAPDAPWVLTDQFTDFCVYTTTIPMPDWQSGTPPFSSDGGTWVWNGDAPVWQRDEDAHLVITVPRSAEPTAGYPLGVFVRTGGGGDRPLVDRGTQAVHNGPALEPGEGPARYFARAGFAGLQVDGPIGGLRNTTGHDEQFLIFNVGNLGAMRDNIRESALELVVIAHVAAGLHLDASSCGGPSDVHFDADHFALMGHSMGGWIAPIAASVEPMYKSLILSGAGGSWIENILYKQQPLSVEPIIAALVQELSLDASDPVLTLSQWALESADPAVYDADDVGKNILMEQGIVDDYILPRIANATSLPLQLDLAGTEYDTESDPRLAEQEPLGPLLALSGRQKIDLPASGNGPGGATAVVVQHLEDGIEDGHEVVFQEDGPKHQYQCFLTSWLAGAASVPVDDTRDAPCP